MLVLRKLQIRKALGNRVARADDTPAWRSARNAAGRDGLAQRVRYSSRRPEGASSLLLQPERRFCWVWLGSGAREVRSLEPPSCLLASEVEVGKEVGSPWDLHNGFHLKEEAQRRGWGPGGK